MRATLPLLRQYGFPAVRRKRLETLQVNLGYRCNQSCVHCHVNAGPTRTEMMPDAVIEEVIRFLPQVATLDITGGAPELHPRFRSLVSRARRLGKHVIDRCNLTILQEPGQADLAAFLAAERVEIIASLPCYTPELVDRQRGAGVYERSIAALRELNRFGYGGELLLRELLNNRALKYAPVGFLDDDPAKSGKLIHGLKVYAGNGDLTEVCRQHNVNEVLISSTVKELVVGSGIKVKDRGAHRLKGVPEEWRLYRVLQD